MSTESGRTPRQRALDSCVMQANARHLIERWRDRAHQLRRYSLHASDAWAAAADELEQSLSVSERADVLDRLLCGLHQSIVRELQADLRGLVAERAPAEMEGARSR